MHEKNEAYEYSRLSSWPLGTFRRTQHWWSQSFPESGQELWWSSVWHFRRRGTDVSLVKRPKREGTQGDGCIRRPREMPRFTP